MAKILPIVCFVGAASAIRIKKSTPWLFDPNIMVNGVRASMQMAPKDFRVQESGCTNLSGLSQYAREGPGPYGGQRVANKWLEAGLYEVIAQGLLNIVAVPQYQESEDDIFEAASSCFNAIGGATVQNDREKTILMFRNSPHVWDAYVGYFQRFRTTKAEVILSSNMPLVMFAGLYGNWGGDADDSLGEISRGLDRAGGFEFILDVLEHNYTNPALFQGALAALSDHLVGSRVGPKLIADNNDGLRLLTNAVRHAQSAPPYHEGNGFGLRYEVLEDVSGFLKMDDNGRFTEAFREEGLMEEVLKLMPQEPNDLFFQDHCCQVFSWLTNSNPAAQRKLAQSAAAELVKTVVTVPCTPSCSWPPPVRSWAHLTDSDPSPSCLFLNHNLEQFAQGRNQWKDWSMRERQP